MTKLEVPTYFLTFTTYGTWLPGDPRGSVDRVHSGRGLPQKAGNQLLLWHNAQRMVQPPFQFDAASRAATEAAIREVCEYRG